MKNLFIPLVASMLTVLPALKAQDCSHWSNFDIRGTYTQSGHGYVDLSKVFGPSFPAGLSPYYLVGAVAYDGRGVGTGWLSFNFAGNQVNAEFVDYTYSMQPNCSVQVSFRLKLTDLGITTGLQRSLKVIVPRMGPGMASGDLELRSIHMGTPLGKAPDASLNLEEMHRISVE
jgi:hypothetical protein